MPHLTENTLDALRQDIRTTASACVDAIVAEVPGYQRGFEGGLRHNIELAVEQALSTFLDVQSESAGADHRASAMNQGAYRLGRGEARSGRTTDALLSAYRVGARVAWSRFAQEALAYDEPAANIVYLAERTFEYIDQLSAQSLAGHTAALTARTRELIRRRDQLVAALLSGESRATLERLAEQAQWNPPMSIAALVIAGEPDRATLTALGDDALWSPGGHGPAIALLPDLHVAKRHDVLKNLHAQSGALGPSVEWYEAGESVRRARRALHISSGATDCDDILPELALYADPLSSDLLAARALAPLADISESKQEVLRETLLSWLLHHGRRDEVAEALHVHPQTVRYRMNTLRELYGGELTDPRAGLELTLGLMAAEFRSEQEQP